MDPGGKLPDTGVIIICGAQLPTWSLPHKHLQQRVALGVARRVVAPKGPSCSLSCLPVLLLCACCWSLDGGEDCHPYELEGAVPGLGPLPGGKLLMGMVCPNTLFQREWV